jgi:hypothetical protein
MSHRHRVPDNRHVKSPVPIRRAGFEAMSEISWRITAFDSSVVGTGSANRPARLERQFGKIGRCGSIACVNEHVTQPNRGTRLCR